MALTVVYDACVLYPATLRDLLIELATTKLFRARWSDTIHDEWMRNILANKPHLQRQQLERTRSLMDVAVPGSVVAGFKELIPKLELPDPDDRHVLAVALQSEAQAIITFNLSDFPARALEPFGLEAIHPDTFLTQLLTLDALRVVQAIHTTRTRLRNPPREVDEHLERLEGQGLVRTVAQLTPYRDLL
jgi:predicted nucleic acid-binding protein